MSPPIAQATFANARHAAPGLVYNGWFNLPVRSQKRTMKKLALLPVLTLALSGLVYADHSYEETASVHDIMEVVQGPSMKALSAMMKAGGPQTADDWKHAGAHISILGETTQLILMGARVKDDPWTPGAHKVIEGSKQGVAAAKAKDGEAFRAAMGSVGAGCRSCHKVYKKKKKK